VAAGIQSFAFYSNTPQLPIRARMRKMFEGRMRMAARHARRSRRHFPMNAKAGFGF
jgi:hypothetical protein